MRCALIGVQSVEHSGWLGEVMGDRQLTRGLRELERSTPAGTTSDRAGMLAHVEDHFLIQRNEAQ